MVNSTPVRLELKQSIYMYDVGLQTQVSWDVFIQLFINFTD